jgi:hypothetical protein
MIKRGKIFIRLFIVLTFLLAGSAILEGTAYAVNVGNPFLIGTSTYGNMAASAPFDGTNYLVGMEEGAGVHSGLGVYVDTQTAQFISQSGTLIGSRIYTGRLGGMPIIGFNGTNYLMVWEDDEFGPGPTYPSSHTMYGKIISPSGTEVKAQFAISATVGQTPWENGPVICNSTKCTVIWSVRDAHGTVYGRDISPDGSFLTSEYTLFTDPRPEPDTGRVSTGAAYDSGGNYLIAIDTGSKILASIKGPTINKSSFEIATKAPTGICKDQNPVGISFDGTNYLVVWNDHSDCTAVPAWDVLAQRIDASGTLVGTAFKVNSTNTWRAALPSIGFDGTNYLVTWTDGRNDTNRDGVCDPGEGTCDDIYGHLVSKSGTLSGSEFIINNDAGNQMGWVTGFNAGKYLVIVNTGMSRANSGSLTGGSAYGVFLDTSSSLYGIFTGAGIWKLDGSSWGQITPNIPTVMAASGSVLSGVFSPGGIWQWDGGTWSQMTPNIPTAIAASGPVLYGNFGPGAGIWKWNGNAWSQITPNTPTSMAASGPTLYGKFSPGGIWKWDGGTWSQVTPNIPIEMAVSGSVLYGNFGTGAGIWKWDGATWSQVTPNSPQVMAASGSLLYGNFGTGAGIWKWDGATWSQVTPNSPQVMAASGSLLYGNFGTGAGIWKWDASTWSQVTPNNPTSMVVATPETPSIVFNYDYDTSGFFTTERRQLVEKAAATLLARMSGTTWERVDAAATGGSYDLAFINPSTWAVTWSSDVVIPKNQITVYLGAVDFSTFPPDTPMHSSSGCGCSQLLSIRNVSGNIGGVLTSASQYRPPNASISFDLQGIQGFSSARTRQWHFDSDGDLTTDDRNPSDPHYNDYTDFFSALIHELGHVLGIHNPQQFSTLIDYDPNFCRAWMNLVQSDGLGGYVFTGSNTKQLYYGHVGVNIPLGYGECHWADGVRSGPSGLWTSVTHESSGPFRVWFSEMEFQALKDIGYVIPAP